MSVLVKRLVEGLRGVGRGYVYIEPDEAGRGYFVVQLRDGRRIYAVKLLASDEYTLTLQDVHGRVVVVRKSEIAS